MAMALVGGGGLTRRATLRLLVSGASLALLSACGGQAAPAAPTSPPPTSAPPATPTAVPKPAAATAAPAAAAPTTPAAATVAPTAATAAGQPRSGGTLRLSIPADVANLDGHSRTTSSYESVWLIFDRLTAYDDKLVPQPMLAES